LGNNHSWSTITFPVEKKEGAVWFESCFLKRCLGDIEQLYFCFPGSGGSGTSFSDVMFAASGGLNHLVNSPVTSFKEFAGEKHGYIIDAFRFLKSYLIPEIPALRQEL
jgi:hypothetical protein